MRIAVCLSGQPRTVRTCWPALKACFRDYETDWFFSTWDDPVHHTLLHEQLIAPGEMAAYEFVAEPDFRLQEERILRAFADTFPDFFILSQWYGVMRVLALREQWAQLHQVEHALVVRCRFDLALDFDHFGQALTHFRPDAVHMFTASTGGYDQFCYGSPQVMRALLDFPGWLLGYGAQFGYQYGFHASPLFKAFFLDRNIPVNHISLPLRVLREYDNSPTIVREARTREYIARHFPALAGRAWAGNRQAYTPLYPAPWDIDYQHNRRLFLKDGAPWDTPEDHDAGKGGQP